MSDTPGALPTLHLKRIGIDTSQEVVVYMRADCHVCRSEGFQAHSRVRITSGARSVIATLSVVGPELLASHEAGLSESAWAALEAKPGQVGIFSHPLPLESLAAVRSKIYGNRLTDAELHAIIGDIAAGSYADVHIAAFVAACGGDRLDVDEITGLTRGMIAAGDHLDWGTTPIVDKHCVGGLPGNRTTLIVVPIVAACGLTMPKTSSRAITSPAGTADTMECLAPVDLDLRAMRRVVEKVGGCVAWGQSVHLSPADDVLIRVERALDIDSEGQLIASVLSKKAAAGSTHVVLDLPVGPTAKVRTPEAARVLADRLTIVGERVGLKVRAVLTDGTQPIGRGIGPALEARDVVAVLTGAAGAPADLRERGLFLAGQVLELAGHPDGAGLARQVLADGRAWAKFQAICEAQGGMREPPPPGPYRHDVLSEHAGAVSVVDNRRLGRVAKLAGAPADPTAGVDLHVRLGHHVERGQPLYTVYAESRGELTYALDYLTQHDHVVEVSS